MGSGEEVRGCDDAQVLERNCGESEKFRKREEGISDASRKFAAMGGMEKGKVEINGKKIHT